MEAYLTQITNYLLTQSWQIAVVVVVVAVVSWLLRNKSAHIRYLLWLIVLAKCLVPPFLSIPLAVLPEQRAVIVLPSTEPIAIELVETFPVEAPAPPAPIIVKHTPRLTFHQLLAVVWFAGAGLFVLVAVVKALRTELWLRRKRKLLPAGLQSEIKELFSSLGFSISPKLWLVEGIGQPFVWGLLRGGIYLPANFVKAHNVEHRRGVLGHELSHILRFDAAVNLLQVVAQAVFWFHPFVWWSNRKIRVEREKCCDEMAIAHLGARAKDYSDAIVNILIGEHESTRPVPSLAIAGPVKNIEERIRTMLKPGKKFYRRPSLISAAVVTLMAVFTVPTALVLTARASEEVEIKAETKPTKSLHQAAAEGDLGQVKELLAAGAAINAKDGNGSTPLHRAVKAGHRAIAMLLIDEGADINAPGRWTARPLHEAAWEGHVDLVKLLIAKDADVNAWQGDYWTPLHSAANQGHKDVAEILIASGADVNLHREGGTPLHTAAGQGQLEMAALLIDKEADIGARDSAGRTPLHVACQAGHDDIVKLFLARGADIEAKEGKEGRTPLHLAALRARKNVAETLLAAGADINSRNDRWNSTPLHDATIPGDMGVITLLVAKGADFKVMDIQGKTAMHNAVEFNRPKVVKFFLARGIDVNQKCGKGNESAPLHIATWKGNKDMIELLLANGADVNVKAHGQTALHRAMRLDKKDMVRFLLAKGLKTSAINAAAFFGELDRVKTLVAEGTDIDAKDECDYSPLGAAACGNQLAVVKFLTAKGAQVDAKNGRGFTALHIASRFGDKDIVELLIAEEATVNLRDDATGRPAVYYAALEGRNDIIDLLIANEADINARSGPLTFNGEPDEGWTPIHAASISGHKAAVELLIEKGAEVNPKTKTGKTPLSLAKDRGHTEIIDLLRKHGARE